MSNTQTFLTLAEAEEYAQATNGEVEHVGVVFVVTPKAPTAPVE